MSRTPVGLLIFDLDGTIVNTLEDIAASLNHALGTLGRPPISLAAAGRYLGDGLETLLARSLEGESALVPRAKEIYTEHHFRNLVVRSTLYPGVKETLEYFQSIPLAIITNKSRRFSEPILKQLGIRQYFKTIIGADSGLPLKPAPDAVLKLIHDYRVSREYAAIVGDGTTDINSGKAAGILTCAATYGYRTEQELRAESPDYVINSISDLQRLFEPGK